MTGSRGPRVRVARRPLAIAGTILAIGVLAGCGTTSSSTGATVSPSSLPPASATATSPGGETPRAAPSTSAAAPSTAGVAKSTAVDPTLLSVLPPTIGGAAVIETPDAERASAGDLSIAAAAERLATAYAASATRSDWVVVSVVALRPGAWSDAFFRDWRDTYDAGVCAAAGGVAGDAQATIGGRQVFIGTCGSLHTYHVFLPDRSVVVSAAAVGERRFGELLMAGLRP